MSRRRRNRKARGPGVYDNGDGSTTTIVEANGMIIETKIRPNPRPGEARKQVVSRAPVAGPPAGIPVSGLMQAPVVRSNVLPGEDPGVVHDHGTGMDFSTRAEYDHYYKEHGLEDMSGKEGARRNQAPSYAQQPLRERSQYVQGFNPMSGEPAAVINEHTLMRPEARQRLFGGASRPNIGRRR
jgi:hypothetical protein